MFINYNSNRFSHEEIKFENGERDMPKIVHFEIPSDDIERSRNFYSELFGWNIEKWTGSMPATAEGMEYWLLSTVDDKGNKATTGGMMKRQSPQQQGITNYFDVKSARIFCQNRKVGRQSYVHKTIAARCRLYCYMYRYRE